MEETLRELFPDETVTVKDYRSFINQPERIQISSQQDINDYDPNRLTTYFNFRVPLPRPALSVKSLQLGRASIPNAVASLPDAETTFWFYALPYEAIGIIYDDNAGSPGDLAYNFGIDGQLYLPNGQAANGNVFFDGSGATLDTTVGCVQINGLFFRYSLQDAVSLPAAFVPVYASNGDLDYWIKYNSTSIGRPKSAYLRYIRLLPSWSPPDLLDDGAGTIYGINRVFQDYSDLVSELNLSANADPCEDLPANKQPGAFKFIPGLASFSYSEKYTKIIMTGDSIPNTPGIFHYMPCPTDDPLWFVAAAQLAQRDLGNPFNFYGVDSIVQPFTDYRNLNSRLGFTYPVFPAATQDYNNMIRPHPQLEGSQNLAFTFSYYDHMAPGYPNLCNTACVLLYTDITGGSTVDTIANKALLASIPMNTASLGIGYHSLPLNNPLTKIPTQINEIYIEMRTDGGEPFYLPNNAIVSCEFILTY